MKARVAGYNLSKVAQLRDKLIASGYLNSYIDSKLTREQLLTFVDDLKLELGKHVSTQALMDSCIYLTQTVLTVRELKTLCWRLAGNVRRLKAGLAAAPWNCQQSDEWMPLQIISVEPGVTESKRSIVTFRFRILAGTGCPLIIKRVFSPRFCGFLSKEFGFSRSYGDLPYNDPREYTSMGAYGLFTQALSVEGQPAFNKFYVPSSLLSQNKQLLAARSRAKSPCPQRKTVDCLLCNQGQNNCPLAIRPRTLERGNCRKCGQAGWYEPAVRALCRKCIAAGTGSVFFEP